MLVAGDRLIEQLFPGVDREIGEAGAPAFDFGLNGLIHFPQGQSLRRRTGLVGRFCSRNLREALIRRRLADYPNVEVLAGCEAAGLLGDGDGVSGVRLRFRGQARPQNATRDNVLRADLVVDASGRDSHNVDWLRDLGFPTPEVSIVRSFLGYSSRIIRCAPDPKMDLNFIALAPAAPDRFRGGVMATVEGGNWIVTLLGAAGHFPPEDDSGFIEWTRSLPSPLIYNMLKDAEPVTPIYSYRRTENSYRHFERMPRWPERFVVLGDAAVCFNPFYSQGMTVSAQCAVELGRTVREHRARMPNRGLTGLARAFQKRLGRLVLAPWMLATGEDFRWPKTEGKRPNPLVKLVQRYAEHVIHLSTEDPEVQQVFYEVQHCVRSPEALLGPQIMAKVLQRTLSRRVTSASS